MEHRSRNRRRDDLAIGPVAAWTAALGVVFWASVALAQAGTTVFGEETRAARVQAAVRAQVGVDQQLNATLPLAATFTDERGAEVRLGDYFDGERPVVLNFAYYSCPVVCDLVLREMIKGLAEIGWTAGDEYDVLSISIDPRDDPAAARATRATLLAEYGRPAERGFHFLTGDGANAKRVADAVGWKYDYLPVQEEYAHPAALVVLTPEGKVARYLLGLRFNPNDLRMGLLEASEGRSISVAEQALVYCYRYDPDSGGYVVVAERVMKIGGGAVAIVIGGTLGWLWRREFRRRRADARAAQPSGAPRSGKGLLKGEAVRTS